MTTPDETARPVPRSALILPTVLLMVAAGSLGVIAWQHWPAPDGPSATPTEQGAFGTMLSSAQRASDHSMSIDAAGHDILQVTMRLAQPAGGSLGPFLVYVDIVDPEGRPRIDGHEEGGVYIVAQDPITQVFRMPDVQPGDWTFSLRLWERSVPVEVEVSWTTIGL